MSNTGQQFNLFVQAHDSAAVHLMDLLIPREQSRVQLVTLPECKLVKTGLPYHWMNMIRCLDEQLLEHSGDEDSLAKWYYQCVHQLTQQETHEVLSFDVMVPNTFTKLVSFFEKNLHTFGLTREHHLAMGTTNVERLLSTLEERVRDKDVNDVAFFLQVDTPEHMSQYLEALSKGFKFPISRELLDFYEVVDFKGKTNLSTRFYAKSKTYNDAVSTMHIFFPPECKETGIILEEETIERERNQGISTALLYHCVKHAAQLGMRQVFVVSNTGTQDMHLGLGFKNLGEFITYKYISHPRRINQQ